LSKDAELFAFHRPDLLALAAVMIADGGPVSA
jgi:hypothetical protein